MGPILSKATKLHFIRWQVASSKLRWQKSLATCNLPLATRTQTGQVYTPYLGSWCYFWFNVGHGQNSFHALKVEYNLIGHIHGEQIPFTRISNGF